MSLRRLFRTALLCALSLTACTHRLLAQQCPASALVVKSPAADQKIPDFYSKFISAHGYPIVASRRVSDFALKEAACLVNQMLAHRPDIRDAMIAGGSRLCILGCDEFTTDLPEFAALGKPGGFEGISAKDYWDARARGTGGSEHDPYCSCGEENLLGYPGDPYETECILIHEFAHNMHLRGLVRIDPEFDTRLKKTYDRAMGAGLWKGKYASVNHHEYFAEGVQSWFDNNRENDHDHNHVNTREELVEYDPGLASICREVFGETELKYTKPATRLRGHLEGFDPAQAPRFVWPERLAAAQKAIRRQAEQRSEAKPARQGATLEQNSQGGQELLTLDRIYGAGEFGEKSVGMFQWSNRTPTYFTLDTAKDGAKGRDLVRNDLAQGTQEIVVPGSAFVPAGQEDPIAVESLQFSADESKILIFNNSQRVWRQNTRGDYWLLDVTTRELKKLGGDAPASSLMFAKFSPDGTQIAYVRDNNLYVQELAGMQITPLTTDGSATVINGTADWVNEEELEIRDGYRWSPDGKSIAYWQFDLAGVRTFTLINNTQGNYSSTIQFPYPKVGEQNSATRVGVVNATGGETRWIDLPGDRRDHYVPRIDWTPDSTQLAVQQMNRLQNSNTVYLGDPRTGAVQNVLTETDPAWLENENPFRWLAQGRRFLWLSERNGWRRAYLAGIDGKSFDAVTPGDFDVIQVEGLDEEGDSLYFAASPENATQRYLYRSSLNGLETRRLSPQSQPGWHTYNLSPDARWAVHTWSTFTTPPVHELVQLPGHEVVRVLEDNAALREKLGSLKRPHAEFVKVDVEPGLQLDAWCLKPPDFNPDATYPLLFYVYGEPFGQTVKDGWNGTTQLWHWMLAQQGYIVASVENRGTNIPRGRDWRKCIHRQIGVLASADQAAAARTLLQQIPQADPRRIGIWGWSGGGSMSLNALFRYPELYSTAIAIASVPDQKLYDTIYQERYMGLPDDNAEGYRLGSPLTFASQLRGNLLLIHGTGDDNVHYQGVEKLMDELVAHHRHFSVMPYPGRSHGIFEGRNTSRHLFTLMTWYLDQNLKGTKPSAQFESEEARSATGMVPGSTRRDVLGWTVQINDRLLTEEPEATARALQLLEAQLQEIARVVPAPAVRKLRQVVLWFSPEYAGVGPRAEYHPGVGWLKENGRNPAMVKGVEFTNIRIFDAETRRMPNFALHELAHAYHDQVLGNDHEAIRKAYENARKSGRYDRVAARDADGKVTEGRAYAMTNPQEYFAETTEAFFSRNDVFPFTRSELDEFDPEMSTVLKSTWGVESQDQ